LEEDLGILPGMRAWLALVLAAFVVAATLPGEFLPAFAAWRDAHDPGWPLWSLLAACLLGFCGWLLPSPKVPAQPELDHTGLTVGLLLMLEPLLHLAVLAVSSQVPTRAGSEALLPLAPPAVDVGLFIRIGIFAIVVPIGEEVFFRGRLLPWLQARLGAVSAVTISAGVFAIAHGDLIQAVIALPVGLLLGVMRARGADLGACMLAHAVHNGLFLLAGPGLIGLPMVAPVLFVAGSLLITFAWYFHLRPRPGQWRHFVITNTVVIGVLLALAPSWRSLQDQLWVIGVHRLCVYWRVGNHEMLARIVAQDRRQHLTQERCDGLVARLIAHPCQTGPRQTGLCALLDPSHAQDSPTWEDDAYELLDELAYAPPPRYDGDIARRLGSCFPEAFADTVRDRPEALLRWLPQPERRDEAALLLAACQWPRDRRQLLTGLERAYPGTVADVVFRVPAYQLTPIDARHLRGNYPDLAERLARLAQIDPARARALGWEDP
jgi:membrane protease YdiL (CAAX protease family)